jgi:hypothetical protein
MPTYKCKRCGNEITLSIKPGQCEFCGTSQFKIINRGQSKFVTLDSGEVSSSSRSSSISKTPASENKTTFQPPSSSDKTSFKKTSSRTRISSSSKTSLNSDSLPSLPLYTGSTSLGVPAKTYNKPEKKGFQRPNFSPPIKWLLPLILAGIGGGGYGLWQKQFDTSDFNKTVLQENFNNPQSWNLTNNASFRNGGLYQRQTRRNHYGSSIWMGKSFEDVDFSADVVKTSGPNDIPFGLITRVHNQKGQKFYYLFINGQGNFVLGKHDSNRWLHRIGWQKHGAINKNNRRNRLRIVVKDNLVIGFINGQQVGSFRDDDYASGRVAVFSMRGKGDRMGVYFDNVVIKERVKPEQK